MKPIYAWRHVPHETLGTLDEILRRAGFECRYVDWFADAPATFDPQSAAGLVVLGGPMNVDEVDKYPFLATEVDWLRRAVAAELPVLGICLGSQLLAKSLGSRVYPNRVKEIGWFPIDLKPAAVADPLFSVCREKEPVFQWHGDTFDLPAGAIHLARSADCEHQAYRYGRVAYGLQFHLEVTPEMVASWLAEPDNCGELPTLPGIDPRQILARTPEEITTMQPLAEKVFAGFVELCRQRNVPG